MSLISSPLICVFFIFCVSFTRGQVNKEDCAPANSSFHKYCTCGGPTYENCGGGIEVEFVCVNLPTFFIDGAVNSKVNCLRIKDSPLETITTEGLKQFSYLTGLVIVRTRLINISNGALDQLQALNYMELGENQLTIVPHIKSMPLLITMYLPFNRISHIDSQTFSGLPNLRILDLHDNELTSLQGNIFSKNCFLFNLTLSDNRIKEIDDDVFTGTKGIVVLSLLNTEISRVPLHENLQSSLEYLDVRQCRNLKTFHFKTQGNMTFPYLLRIRFPYSAHCCQLTRLVEQENASQLTMSSTVRRRQLEESQRTRRHVAAEMLVCVNVSSSECVPESVVMETNMTRFISVSEFCSVAAGNSSCSSCLDDICSDMCASSNSSASENSNRLLTTSNYTTIVCLLMPSASTPTPSAPVTPSVPVTLTTTIDYTICIGIRSSSMCNLAATPTPTPLHPDACLDRNVDARCVQMVTDSSSSDSTDATPPTNVIPLATPTTVHQATLSPTIIPEATPTSEVTAAPTTSAPLPPIDCSGFNYCFFAVPFEKHLECSTCQQTLCQYSYCTTFFPRYCSECFNQDRKRRSADDDSMNAGGELARNKRELVEAGLSPVVKWFPNFSDPFCCTVLVESDDISTPKPRVVLTGCYRIGRLRESHFSEIQCSPEEDAFNPCLDLLGSSPGLRVCIWVVIVLAFLGNGLVFVVFIGYSVIIRKTAQEMFTVQFMYFNLAAADFFMGMYLFIIAIVDAETFGEFYLSDIAWRSGHGCGFAGFCAILSTVVSVYVLLVITLERTYTIVRVFKKQKLTKTSVSLVMLVGWVLGVIIAALPLLGVSDYSTVAICLPFNVETGVNQAYVVILLLATGISFIVIAICYVIIFRQIFCNPNKVTPVLEGKRRASDTKIAIRILILVVTNFVCWFPIALIGLTAAFNNSLVNDLDFARWAMVLIFPINACLNPLLYSLTTRVFRDQFVLLLSHCGLCKKRAHRIRNAKIGITPSQTSKTSRRNGNISSSTGFVNRLRNFSLVTQTSSISLLNLMNRRTSASSSYNGDSRRMSFLNSYLRRSSNISGASSDELENSRRGSTFSTGSNEANTTFYNAGHVSNGSLEANGEALVVPDIHTRARTKISASSLSALPEEVELTADVELGGGVVKINPVYEDESEEASETSNHRDSGLEEDKEDEFPGEAEIIANQNANHQDTLDFKKDNEDTESGSGSL